MKAKKMWVAEHPEQPGNFEIVFSDPCEETAYVDGEAGFDGMPAKWVEYVIIPIDEG